MNSRNLIFGIVAMICSGIVVQTAVAADFSITVTNATNGSYFTPLLVSAHSDGDRIFRLGQAASAQLQAMAEGGDISGLATQLGGADDDTVVDPAGGLLAPGESVTTTLNTDGSGNTYLSIAAMILPTNDGFVGIDSLPLPTTAGTYVYSLLAYDAGTEANDERVVGGAGGTPGVAGIPAAPGGDNGQNGTGVTTAESNATVHIHRGVIGDTDANGGASDLDRTVHRWLNPVAKLTIAVQ